MPAFNYALRGDRGGNTESASTIREYRIPESIAPDACGGFRGLRIQWDAGLGLGFADRMPGEPELAAFYATEYRRVMGKETGLEYYVDSPNYVAQARSLVAWVEPLLLAEGRWLDVGAAFGLLLGEVNRIVPRWDLHAVEAAQEAWPHLERIALLETDVAAFWRGESGPRGCFDVVSLVHVLEHLRDPWAALRELRARLKPGGLLLLEVPNDTLEELRRPGRASDLPHLWFFSEAGLCRIARDAGFEVVRAAPVGLRREGVRAPFARRVQRTARRMIGGRMSLVQDRDWYTEAADRCDLRLLCRRPAGSA